MITYTKEIQIKAILAGIDKNGDIRQNCIKRINECGVDGVENESLDILLDMCHHLKGFTPKVKKFKNLENTNLFVLGFPEMENLIQVEFEKFMTFNEEVEIVFLKSGATVYSVFKNGRRPIFSTRVIRNKNSEIVLSFSFNSFRIINDLRELFNGEYDIEKGDEFNNLPVIKFIKLTDLDKVFLKIYKNTTLIQFLIDNLNKKYRK